MKTILTSRLVLPAAVGLMTQTAWPQTWQTVDDLQNACGSRMVADNAGRVFAAGYATEATGQHWHIRKLAPYCQDRLIESGFDWFYSAGAAE